MISEAIALNDTTPVKICSSVNFEQEIYIHNELGGAIYIGGSDVSSSTGYHLANHEAITMKIPQDNELYGISGSGAGDVHIVRPD